MSDRLGHLDRYLENTERLIQALEAEDLETVNRCLDSNAGLMKMYDRISMNEEIPADSRALKEKFVAAMKVNRQCFVHAEHKCRALRMEIEGTDRNRIGLKKYGGKQAPLPRFIDNTL